jgi:hypothetical protein
MSEAVKGSSEDRKLTSWVCVAKNIHSETEGNRGQLC